MQQALEWCGSCWALDCNLLCQVWILPKHKYTCSVFSIQVGGLHVGLHYNTVVCARGYTAAGAHAPLATARRKKRGSTATDTAMKRGNNVFHNGNMAPDWRHALYHLKKIFKYINQQEKIESAFKILLWDQNYSENNLDH